MTTIIPVQPSPEQSVYIGGEMDWPTEIMSGGAWSQPMHGGVCQGNPPRPAVTGLHLHWNGSYYVSYYISCPLREHCPEPSCHPATGADVEETRREAAQLTASEVWLDAL